MSEALPLQSFGAPLPTSYNAAMAQATKAQDRLYANTSDLPVIPWVNLHALTGPIIPGDLWVVGARPSNGKSTMMLNLFDELTGAGFPTLYIGAGSEGPPEDARRQWAALRLGFPADAVLEGRWHDLPPAARDQVFMEVQRAATDEHEIAHFADVGQRLTPEALVEAVKIFQRQPNARYVLLDHIHRLRLKAGQDVRRALSSAVQWLRDQAAERDWGVVIAAQLHRAPNVNGSLRDLIPPTEGDLKETGTLEEDGVVILLLHRVKRPDATQQQIHAVSKGDRPITDVLDPNCMAVRVAKHRRRGYNKDKTAFLHVDVSGRLTARAEAWRMPRSESDDTPF